MKSLPAFRSALLPIVALTGLLVIGSSGCRPSTESKKQQVLIDGSSTVEPISSQIGSAFHDKNEKIDVIVKTSGTGGGFKKFIAKEIDIADASRPIKDEEKKKLEEAGVDYTELKVALDGISVVVNPENTEVTELTIEQLRDLFKKDSPIEKWSDMNPEWPDEEIKFYTPDTDSGTYDYFNEEILGDGVDPRKASTSVQDTTLVDGVADNKYAIGYFGFSYYEENKDKLKAVAIVPEGKNAGEGVKPTRETVESGVYSPLSRPLFIYVSNKSLKEKSYVADFVKFYLNEGQGLVPKAGYIKLNEEQVKESREKLEAAMK